MDIYASFEDFPVSVQKELTEITEEYMKDINNWSLFKEKLVLDYKINHLQFRTRIDFLLYIDVKYLTKTEILNLTLAPIFFVFNIDLRNPYLRLGYYTTPLTEEHWLSSDFIKWIKENVW
jgi:hypothetical protein